MKSVLKFFAFTNLFYGLLACSMYLETLKLADISKPDATLCLMIFFTTIFYYTASYRQQTSGYAADERESWYVKHERKIKFSQHLLLSVIAALACFSIRNFPSSGQVLASLPFMLLSLSGLVIAILYNNTHSRINLRRFGILKPFFISYVWITACVFIPLWFHAFFLNELLTNLRIIYLHAAVSFLFLGSLCILFDVKDITSDLKTQLHTIPGIIGLRRTTAWVIFPVSVLSLFINHLLQQKLQTTLISELISSIILLLPVPVSLSLFRSRSLLYFLFLIDGLILVKSVFNLLIM